MSETRQSARTPTAVLTVTEARTQLPSVLDEFRASGLPAEPVFFGSHRKAEGVIIPIELFHELMPAIDEVFSSTARVMTRGGAQDR